MKEENIYSNARIVLTSEYLFVLLPFIVIGIIRIYTATFSDLIKAADWSFASSILLGQVIVKLVAGAIAHKNTQWQRVVFLASLIIVLGLVPCLITLALLLIDNGKSTFLVNMQITIFCLSTLVFFWIGSASHVMFEKVNK